MIKNDFPLVAIISMGHTGSRLLTQLLNDNGIFMGRTTCVPGEDSRIGITNDRVFEQAVVKYHLSHNKQELKDLLYNQILKYETNNLEGYPITFEIKERVKNIVFGKYLYFKNRPSNTWAYGIKTAISSTMYCEALYDLAIDLKKTDKICFIHLTRNLNDWLRSGLAKGTKGIKRPIYLTYANNFLNDYNKLLWFNSVSNNININDKQIDLQNYSLSEMEKDRIYIESELWANCNNRVLKTKEKGAKYIQIKYEDVLLNQNEVAQDLSLFFNKKFQNSPKKIDTSRFRPIEQPLGCSANSINIQKFLNY